MKKGLVLCLSALLVLSMTGCSAAPEKKEEKPAAGQYTAGTYTGKAEGMDGEIQLEVTFSESEITAVSVVSHNETAGIGTWPLESVPEDVIKNQSLAVDTVSGATITSRAVIEAIADAVEQAGGSVETLKQAAVASPAEDLEETVDVVVAGGGLSGLMAALEAAEAGASVALVEKTGVIGGTSVTSSGTFACAETDELVEPMFKAWQAKNSTNTRNQIEDDMVMALCEASPEVVALMNKVGVESEITLSEKDGSQTFASLPSEAAIRNAEAIKLASAEARKKGGENTIATLLTACEKAGVKIYLNTPATELIINESGAVTGLISKTEKYGTKTFNAKAVVLATGDYAQNAEMTAKINPRAAGEHTASTIGNTGDGITLALSAGGVLDEFQESMSGVFNANPFDMPTIGQPKNSYPFEAIVLTMDGQRAFREDGGSHQQMVYYIRDNDLDTGWCVMDQAIADHFLRLDEYLADTANGNTLIQAFKADTLEELAGKMKVDAAVLANTVEEYNGLCEKKEDPLGKDPQYLSAIDEGPYYAVLMYDGTRGNFGGIVTNTEAAVVNEQGQAIEGLYAGGIVSSGAFFADYYPGGEALAVASHMGFIAGRSAAAYAAK